MKTLVPKAGVAGKDKWLHATVFCGMQCVKVLIYETNFKKKKITGNTTIGEELPYKNQFRQTGSIVVNVNSTQKYHSSYRPLLRYCASAKITIFVITVGVARSRPHDS